MSYSKRNDGLIFDDFFMLSVQKNHINDKPYYEHFFDTSISEKTILKSLAINKLKSIIGPEKVKLYDSFTNKEFIQKIQEDISSDERLMDKKMNFSLTFTDPSLYKEGYDQIYFKIINKEKGNHGFFYKENELNFDTLNFYPMEQCKPGGLYSCEFSSLGQFIKYTEGSHILPVIIPKDIPNYFENGFKRKSPVLYALHSIPLYSYDYYYLQETLTDRCINWFTNNILYKRLVFQPEDYESNQKILKMIQYCFDSHLKTDISYHIDTDIFLWNLVKKMLHEKKLKELYERILLPKKNNHYFVKPSNVSDFDKLNPAKLFYIFYQKKDSSYVQFLKDYLFPKLIEENKDNKIHLQPDINIEKIGDQLKKIFKSPLLIEMIKIGEGIISGSILLEFLMHSEKNKMKSNDVDIYFSYNNFLGVFNFIVRSGILFIEGNTKKKNTEKSYHMKGVKYIYTIHDKKYSDKSVQLIFVDNDDPCQFIFDNFDFDSCMNCFSLKDNLFNLGHPSIFQLHQMTISDKYMDKIFVNKDNYSMYRTAKTIERSIKYIQRGFKITNLDFFLNDILSKLFSKD